MRVSRLALTDFRNYDKVSVDLDAGPTLLIGSNGQGKTNMVEALVYIASGSSHRVPSDAPMVKSGADSAVIRTVLTNGEREFDIDVQLNRQGANRAQANGNPVPMRDLGRYLQAVLFSPEDLALVRGEPSGRRKLLDQLLVARAPRMAGVLADLDRVLKQRSSLLKSARAQRLRPEQLTSLEVWDARLAELGIEVVGARRQLVEDLSPHVERAYLNIAGEDQATRLALESIVPSSTADYLTMLQLKRAEELDRGVCLFGPHRDDLHLELNGLLARHYASHGESWSLALAMRLAGAELMRHDAAGDPVVILDDVFAELDVARRDRLAEAVASFEQVLITAAVEDDVPAVIGGRHIRIVAGRIFAGEAGEEG